MIDIDVVKIEGGKTIMSIAERLMREGMEKGKIEATANIIRSLGISVTKAMDITKIPSNTRDQLIAELKRLNVAYTE